MKKMNLNQAWEFCKETPAIYFPIQGMNGKQIVNLPHDIDIGEAVDETCPDGAQKGFYRGHYGVYTKYIDIPREWEGKKIFMQFDGVFGDTEITLNGHPIALHHYGYSPFSCELTEYLIYGEKNRIAVFVNNSAQYTARWYSGTGIYRHVYLRVGGEVYLPVDPVFAYTESLKKDCAVVAVETEVVNSSPVNKTVKVQVLFYEDQGRGQPLGALAAAGEGELYLPANAAGKSKVKALLKKPKVWNLDTPNLYRVSVRISENGEELDSEEVLFGVRTLELDRVHGLRLNGQTVKIKGGCVHHDNGILGAKSFYDSEFRRMKLHKENGFNGIRCAHNPMSSEMMEACDRLGLLVFAEAFDVWNVQKNINDYHQHFEACWERDLTDVIKRDRNHPCIFCWSIGNEVGERNGLKGGAETAAKLSAKVRELDHTRFVTSAVPTMFNGMTDADTVRQLNAMMQMGGPEQNLCTPWSQEVWANRTKAYCAPLDFVGYNYLEMRYERDGEEFPSRIICGTESYPADIDLIWEQVERFPYVIGDFVWTSQDYLGETGCGNIRYIGEGEKPVGILELRFPQFPNRTANCGNFDLLGHGMPALHFRKIVWGSGETYIAVKNPANFGKTACRTAWAWDDCDNRWSWNGFEGKPIEIEVYSAAEEVELFLGGKSQGRVPAGKQERFRAKFTATYEAGEITAVSYVNGKEISRQTLKTPKKAAGIALTPDKTVLTAGGDSLAFVDVAIVDQDGNRVFDEDEILSVSVSGSAELAAFGSANYITDECYTAGKFTSYRGRLLAVVRSGCEAGEATLTVESEKFGKTQITLSVI